LDNFFEKPRYYCGAFVVVVVVGISDLSENKYRFFLALLYVNATKYIYINLNVIRIKFAKNEEKK